MTALIVLGVERPRMALFVHCDIHNAKVYVNGS